MSADVIQFPRPLRHQEAFRMYRESVDEGVGNSRALYRARIVDGFVELLEELLERRRQRKESPDGR